MIPKGYQKIEVGTPISPDDIFCYNDMLEQSAGRLNWWTVWQEEPQEGATVAPEPAFPNQILTADLAERITIAKKI